MMIFAGFLFFPPGIVVDNRGITHHGAFAVAVRGNILVVDLGRRCSALVSAVFEIEFVRTIDIMGEVAFFARRCFEGGNTAITVAKSIKHVE